MIKRVVVGCLMFLVMFNAYAALQKGDLLFQDLACGELCDAIASTTVGYDGISVSHIGMVSDTSSSEPMVIEAYNNGVNELTLSSFLGRSADKEGRPLVMVGRLKPEYQYLIPSAVAAARQQLGQPYNSDFLPSSQGFYCAQLVYYAFKEANQGSAFFVLSPMNFKDVHTHRYPEAWRRYFNDRRETIPQGVLGINPGAISLDSRVEMVFSYSTVT